MHDAKVHVACQCVKIFHCGSGLGELAVQSMFAYFVRIVHHDRHHIVLPVSPSILGLHLRDLHQLCKYLLNTQHSADHYSHQSVEHDIVLFFGQHELSLSQQSTFS